MPTARTTRSRRVSADETPPWTGEVDEDEEEAPKTSRLSRSKKEIEVEEDEEEHPKSTRLSRAKKVVEDEVDGDEDDEETAVHFTSGRAAIQAAAAAAAGGVRFNFLDDGEEQVVKFLDVEPWSYLQHWVTRAGKQSFPCIGKECPLCEIGVKTSTRVVFIVLNLSLPDGPEVQAMDVTKSRADTLFGYDVNKKVGPLPKLWWSISRTELPKPKGFEKYEYQFLPLRDRDLEDEEYDISIEEAEAAVKKAKPLTKFQVHGKVTRRMLQEIADEAMAE